MASIQKRGKTYQYTISRRINGVQKPIRKGGFRSGKEAATAAKEIELQLVKGLNPVLKPVIFADYFEQWIELYKVPKVSKITLEHYKYSLRAVKDFFKDTPMQNIRRPDYQKFLNWFGSTRAKETLAKVNGHIKSCVDDALEDQIVHLNFTRKAELNWTVPAKKEADKFLNYQDEERLMEKIWSKRDLGIGYSLLLLAAVSGMRFEELVGLTRSDFDFNKGTIRINKTWGYKKYQPRGFGPTKNEQSIRTIQVSNVVMKHFEQLFKKIARNHYDLVFYSPSSKYKVISNTNANKLLKKLLQELNVPPITVHGLRHTHASTLFFKEKDEKGIISVSKRLGHADKETTLRKYAHVFKEQQQRDEKMAANIFDEMLRPCVSNV